MSPPKANTSKPFVGWREWISLPGLGIKAIKVKIDTGARSSCLHAFDVKLIKRGGKKYVRFGVHPLQRSTNTTVVTEAEILEYRKVKSSTGHSMLRPVIITEVEMRGMRWPIEVTLANRDEMGFRMLLGREAVRDRFLVDPGRSYYGGRPGRKRLKKRIVKRKPSHDA